MAQGIPIAEAKAHLAETIRRAESGETVVLTRHGRPVARLAPIVERESPQGPAIDEIRETTGGYKAEAGRDLAGGRPGPAPGNRREALQRLLEDDIWPRVPTEQFGRSPDKKDREKILGYGRDGV